jgi:hypothetical protein
MGARAVWGSNGKGPRNGRELNVAVNTSQRISILNPPPSLSIAYHTISHAAPNTASPRARAAMPTASHVALRDLSPRSGKVGCVPEQFTDHYRYPARGRLSPTALRPSARLCLAAVPAQVSGRWPYRSKSALQSVPGCPSL